MVKLQIAGLRTSSLLLSAFALLICCFAGIPDLSAGTRPNEKSEELINAAKDGDYVKVQELLAKKADVNARTPGGERRCLRRRFQDM